VRRRPVVVKEIFALAASAGQASEQLFNPPRQTVLAAAQRGMFSRRDQKSDVNTAIGLLGSEQYR
jgi:hypothetical protein